MTQCMLNLNVTRRSTPSPRRRRSAQATERAIDREERKLVNKAYATCKETLKTNRALMQALVDALLDRETVDGAELERLVAEKAVVSTFAAA